MNTEETNPTAIIVSNQRLKASEVVKTNVLQLVAYHGTFSDIKAFDEAKAGVGFLGMGFYFTSNRLDASDNYANAPKFGSLTGIDMSNFDNSGVVMPSILSLKNPLFVGGKDETKFSLEDGSLNRFITSFQKQSRLFPLVPASSIGYMSVERFPLEARKARGQYLSMEDIVDLVRRQLGLNVGFINGDSRSKMALLQSAFADLGYDGVIYNDVKKRFGEKMESITSDTRHYVVFKPDQIRTAIGFDLSIQ
jgi:hypothetical protein